MTQPLGWPNIPGVITARSEDNPCFKQPLGWPNMPDVMTARPDDDPWRIRTDEHSTMS